MKHIMHTNTCRHAYINTLGLRLELFIVHTYQLFQCDMYGQAGGGGRLAQRAPQSAANRDNYVFSALRPETKHSQCAALLVAGEMLLYRAAITFPIADHLILIDRRDNVC